MALALPFYSMLAAKIILLKKVHTTWVVLISVPGINSAFLFYLQKSENKGHTNISVLQYLTIHYCYYDTVDSKHNLSADFSAKSIKCTSSVPCSYASSWVKILACESWTCNLAIPQ